MLDPKEAPVVFTKFGNMLEDSLHRAVGWEVNGDSIVWIKEWTTKTEMEINGALIPGGEIVKREVHAKIIEGLGDFLASKVPTPVAEMEQGQVNP